MMNKTFLLCVAVPLTALLSGVVSNSDISCRSSCVRSGIFTAVSKDRSLIGHVIETISVQDSLECSKECLVNPTCQSFNLEDTGTPKHSCELSSQTKVTNPSMLIRRPGFTYFEVATSGGSGWCGSVCQSSSKDIICPSGYGGRGCEIKMRGCDDWYYHGYTSDGVYYVIPGEFSTPVPIYCEQTLDDGGWSVIQRRVDGSLSFDRTWDEYKFGFGNLSGEHWLGNQIIYQMTRDGAVLRVDIEAYSGKKAYAVYSMFKIGSNDDDYRITASYLTGDAADSICNGTGGELLGSTSDGMYFSTKDRNNDLGSGDCAHAPKGGWWFDGCSQDYLSNLNGEYLSQGMMGGITWKTWGVSGSNTLKACQMKIR
ncbi:techylectin-5B isoform X2 [Nematostella vectensis]|nr:techylectin-5B isoform X2 [Nematostella vectensis]